MRLISLEIMNFRVIKSSKIEFPDKVIAIVGKNGSGKSSIIEAISWALYGNQAARSGKDEIKSTFASEAENCEVKVQFYINEEKFTVIRRLVGRSNRAEVELFRSGKSESVGVNETKAHVGQLLGLDWRGFLSSFLARQSELNALSDLVPSKRKDHIAGMLGIERLDKAIQSVKQDTKLYKEKTQFLERSLSEKDSIEKAINELQSKLQKIEVEIEPQNENFKNTQKEFEVFKERFEDYSERKIKFIKAESEIKAQKGTLELLQNQLEQLQIEKSKLSEQQLVLKELQLKQEEFKDIPVKLEQFKRQQSNKKFVDNLKSQNTAILQKVEQNRKTVENLNLNLEELEKKDLSFPTNLSENILKQKSLLEDKRSQFSALKTENKRLVTDIEKLRIQQLNIEELKSNSVCERCHRPLGDDFESIKKHIEDEILLLEQKLNSKTKDQNIVLLEGEKLKKSTEQLELLQKEQLLLKQQIETTQKELLRFQHLAKEFLAQKEEISKKSEEIGEVDFDENEFEQISNKFKQFELNRNEINKYQGQLERLPVLLENINTTNSKIISTQKVLNNETENQVEIGYSEEEFKKITLHYNQAQKKLEDSKNRLFEIQKEKELTSLSLLEKQKQQDIFKKSEIEFEESKTAHYYGEKLSSLFSLYRSDLIASIRPTLADISSRLFNEMTGNKYALVELDEKYELRVMDNGQFYGVERFSGGEKDLANLCLRLAISLSLAESAGLNRSFIILDEVFGSQDLERKDLILTALANLKNRFPQIILITHIEDIKDGVEQVLEVRQNDLGFSEVVVHGA